MSGPTLPRLMSVGEVAQALGKSRATAHAWVVAGRIPHFRVGRRIYIRRGEFERWDRGELDTQQGGRAPEAAHVA